MFIDQNLHVAMGGTNVAKAGLGNIVSTHSNMKVLNIKFHNTKQTGKQRTVHAQLQMTVYSVHKIAHNNLSRKYMKPHLYLRKL